jgi:Trk-type K+ transport system membrane component
VPGSEYFPAPVNLQTWVRTIAMLVGRLEIFTVLILFTPHFWCL